MKLLMVANVNETNKRYNSENMLNVVAAQIENSIEVGWAPKDIIIVSNKNFEFMGVIPYMTQLNDFCLSGSKMFALKFLLEHDVIKDDLVWAKDLDCWQNVSFPEPVVMKDVGICTYSNGKYNGGSIFWKPKAKDIINVIVQYIQKHKQEKEEPALNFVLKHEKVKHRVEKLNYTYNVGCSGFVPRYESSLKPVRVCHFNPMNSIAWEIHGLDRDGIGAIAVTIRLERLLRKYYPNLATKLKPRKKKDK